MHAYLRRLCAPSPVPIRLLSPFPRSSHRGYFSSVRLLEEMRADAPVKIKIAYRRIITSLPRLSLKSRTKASLLAEWDLEVARVRAWSARVDSSLLERWTAKKMCLPSVTAFAVEQEGAPKSTTARQESTPSKGAGVATALTTRLQGEVDHLHPSNSRQRLLQPSKRLFSTSHSNIIEGRKQALTERIAADAVVDLQQVMADLRDLELLEKLHKTTVKAAAGFKDASRCLYPLWHDVDQGKKSKVTFAELQEALPPIYSVPWTHIAERLTSGTNSKLSTLSEKDKAALLLLRVYNIGSSRSEAFVAAGARTLEDLEPLARRKKISLVRAHKIGLRHFDDIERLIPRSEMMAFDAALRGALRKADPLLECELLGSFRRQASFSSDVDLVVRHKSFVNKDDEEAAASLMRRIVEVLEGENLLDDENRLMFGPKKYAGLARLPGNKHYRRIDIRLAPYHSYPYLLLGCSGDALLMKLLRHAAKKRGLCLNEYGLGEKYTADDQNPNGFKPGTLRVVKDEREIFDLLGFPYLTPKERDYAVWRPRYERAGVDLSHVHKL
ncbi:hypothetical protein BCR35DRAFT_336274 [Leucosporidium creatinivorum]|uniref:DNA polymerase n=1 Tax=Leucosporidium creatinivorum TaxID=106004 RepID=A0A1Y2CEH7_9BASI|nr:hypothetical protein BCR35DRAFT_336274 [Leucosporidium creatinivorum]